MIRSSQHTIKFANETNSRNGENFECVKCKMKIDADYNAALNILHRGVYSPSATKINNLIKKIYNYSR